MVGEKLRPRPHQFLGADVGKQHDAFQHALFLLDQRGIGAGELHGAFQVANVQVGLGFEVRPQQAAGEQRGHAEDRQERIDDADRRGQGNRQPHGQPLRLQDAQALGQHLAEEDDRHQRAHGESPGRRRMAGLLHLEADDRADREERQVDDQVPEQHGRQQPVGVVQQPGDDLLCPGALRQLPALGPAKREHGRLAGRKKGRAEQQDDHR